jgi:hypothetical protein
MAALLFRAACRTTSVRPLLWVVDTAKKVHCARQAAAGGGCGIDRAAGVAPTLALCGTCCRGRHIQSFSRVAFARRTYWRLSATHGGKPWHQPTAEAAMVINMRSMLSLRRALALVSAGLVLLAAGVSVSAEDDARMKQLRLLCIRLSGDLTDPGGMAAFQRCLTTHDPLNEIRRDNNLAPPVPDDPNTAP